MTAPKLPPLPEGCPARFRCESCEGSGRDGHMMYQGEFQPPEDGPCPDCDGRGWHQENNAVDADQMRAYGLACYRQGLEDAAKDLDAARPAGGRAWTSEQSACFEALSDCAKHLRAKAKEIT